MHGCMPGCVVRCSIVYPDKDGKQLCAAYEYETIAMLGTNLGITDPDAIARLKFICDDLGVDAVETGSSLGLAAEARNCMRRSRCSEPIWELPTPTRLPGSNSSATIWGWMPLKPEAAWASPRRPETV